MKVSPPERTGRQGRVADETVVPKSQPSRKVGWDEMVMQQNITVGKGLC